MIRSRTLVCSLTALAMLAGVAAAQDASPREATTAADERVERTTGPVWHFLHAKNGDHWFGSPKNGVYRVHDRSLTHFTTAHGLLDDSVNAFAEDASGNILISTAQGVCRFDGRNFTKLEATESAAWAMAPDDVWIRGNADFNEIYRFTEGKLFRLHLPPYETGPAQRTEDPKPVADPYGIYTIYRDRSGALWFGTVARGVFRFDGTYLGWFYLDHLNNTPNGGAFGIRSILEDHEGKYWICNTRSRFTFEPSSETLASPQQLQFTELQGIARTEGQNERNPIYFQSIAEDAAHNLWMVTYRNGVWRYDGRSLKQYWIREGDTPLDLFSLFLDRDGKLFVGTQSAGVYCLDGESFVPFKP